MKKHPEFLLIIALLLFSLGYIFIFCAVYNIAIVFFAATLIIFIIKLIVSKIIK